MDNSGYSGCSKRSSFSHLWICEKTLSILSFCVLILGENIIGSGSRNWLRDRLGSPPVCHYFSLPPLPLASYKLPAQDSQVAPPPGGWGVYLNLRWASSSHRNLHHCYLTHPSLCSKVTGTERAAGGSRHRAILLRGRTDTRTIFLREADCFPILFGEHTHT